MDFRLVISLFLITNLVYLVRINEILLLFLNLYFHSSVSELDSYQCLLNLTDEFLFVETLELYRVYHFFEEVFWEHQIFLYPFDLLLVPDIKRLLFQLATRNANTFIQSVR